FNHWVDRSTGAVVENPPYPVPTGWLADFGWRISRERVVELATSARDDVAFLCGSVENEVEVWDLFDRVACLVIDDDTLRHRLATRTTNAFGKLPEQLAAAVAWNRDMETQYRR